MGKRTLINFNLYNSRINKCFLNVVGVENLNCLVKRYKLPVFKTNKLLVDFNETKSTKINEIIH